MKYTLKLWEHWRHTVLQRTFGVVLLLSPIPCPSVFKHVAGSHSFLWNIHKFAGVSFNFFSLLLLSYGCHSSYALDRHHTHKTTKHTYTDFINTLNWLFRIFFFFISLFVGFDFARNCLPASFAVAGVAIVCALILSSNWKQISMYGFNSRSFFIWFGLSHTEDEATKRKKEKRLKLLKSTYPDTHTSRSTQIWCWC